MEKLTKKQIEKIINIAKQCHCSYTSEFYFEEFEQELKDMHKPRIINQAPEVEDREGWIECYWSNIDRLFSSMGDAVNQVAFPGIIITREEYAIYKKKRK